MQPRSRPVFTVEATGPAGRRAGTLSGGPWRLRTPAAVPVGPLASSGSLTADDLAACGVRALGVDWLRLLFRPGVEATGSLGGLARFAGWSGPTIAGSAAWAFANATARVSADEARVVSPFDGSSRRLTPESAVDAQVALGLDVVAALDWTEKVVRGARGGEVARRRVDWAERSLAAAGGRAFVLGSVSPDWPVEVVRDIGRLPVGGFGLEGLRDGPDPSGEVARVLAELPESALRVVDWRGGLGGLAAVVDSGVDLVRLPGEAGRARDGLVLTVEGEVSALSDDWADDPGPLESGCACSTCARYSRAYVLHLFAASELLGPRLVEIHNVARLVGVVQRETP